MCRGCAVREDKLFALHPPLPRAVAAVTLAFVDYRAGLLRDRLLSLTPAQLGGHALGFHSSGLLALQGVGAAPAARDHANNPSPPVRCRRTTDDLVTRSGIRDRPGIP